MRRELIHPSARCFAASLHLRELIHPKEPQRLSVPCSGPTTRDAWGVPFRGRDRTESEVLSEPRRCYHEGMPACRSTERLHTLSESDAGLASPSGDQAQRLREQSWSVRTRSRIVRERILLSSAEPSRTLRHVGYYHTCMLPRIIQAGYR